LNEDVKFDLVIASEIIEHVADSKTFLTAALRCLKTNSLGLILSTLNRTSQSLLGAIVAAEYILRWVPKGTHEWKRFLKPSEIDILLKNIARENKEVCYSWSDLCGLKLNPFRKKWSYTRNMSNNYIGYITRI
jgi:2-polyprenyl-6-hydroxyphenyl methylase/3-demethylubiquinone-9 3-methyltransferase